MTLGKISLLGDVSASVYDGEPLIIPGRRAKELLAAISVEPGSVSRDKLCASIWPESSEINARRALNTELWRLRGAVRDAGSDSDDWFESEKETIRLRAENGIDVDVHQFKLMVDAAQNQEIESIVAAIEIYRGDFALGMEATWLESKRLEFRNHFVRLLEYATSALRRAQNYARALDYAERLIREEPFDERGHRALLLAQIESGDHASAVRHYRELEQLLERELGILPSPETRAVLGTIEVTMPIDSEAQSTLSEDELDAESFSPAVARAQRRLVNIRAVTERLLTEVEELEKILNQR